MSLYTNKYGETRRHTQEKQTSASEADKRRNKHTYKQRHNG